MSRIEDALNKAKQMRDQGGAPTPKKQVPSGSKDTAAGDDRHGLPHDYRSVFHRLDPAEMEENRVLVLAGRNCPVTEQFRKLRTRIFQKTEEEQHQCLMVTSALDGEGKTTTAVNLAGAIAREVQKTVLLVDADFRRPSVHKLLGIDPEKGLLHYLVDDVPLDELLVRTGEEKLSFLPAGGTLQNSPEVLRSEKMQRLIRELKGRYDDRYIIFDTTPLLPTADPAVLAQFMDGIILVVEADRTTRAELGEAIAHLEGRNILGIVMNNLSEAREAYYYYD